MAITLEDFREKMEAEVEKTQGTKNVQVLGRNLDDALKQASLELALPVRMLEYEVIDRGRYGLFGFARSPCRIIAYEKVKPLASKEQKNFEDELDLQSYDDDSPAFRDSHGRLSVRLTRDGAWVKVFPPRDDEGIAISLEDVVGGLYDRHVTDIDMSIIEAVVSRADMMWVKVGQFAHNPMHDATMELHVSDDAMKAYMTAQEPSDGGADLSIDDIKAFLYAKKITHGILDETLEDFESFPLYATSILIAEGKKSVRGEDAKVVYNFEVEPEHIHLQEKEDGSVDFKELNRFQNVIEGQPLARKIPPTEGERGFTVYGHLLDVQHGNDIDIEVGKNVILTEDASVAVAATNGHALLQSGKITVETVLLIPGNVDHQTGNVNVLGSVLIKGNVEDGFLVTAEGSIEISGFVGKANLNAGGDIILARGINGGEGEEFGDISAGKSIWSSFIQNAQITAGEFVIVSSGIVNSNVSAQKKVLCRGRRAKIVGGHVRASEEVNAVIIGSSGGTSTLIEVGFDPKAKEEIEALIADRDAVKAELNTILVNLKGMQEQFKTRPKSMNKEKKQLFKTLIAKNSTLNSQLRSLGEEVQKRQEYLELLVSQGLISASSKVLSGVVLRMQNTEYVVKDPYEHGVTFFLEDNTIRTKKYQKIKEDLTRR